MVNLCCILEFSYVHLIFRVIAFLCGHMQTDLNWLILNLIFKFLDFTFDSCLYKFTSFFLFVGCFENFRTAEA